MADLTLAAAQTLSIAGDVPANLQRHLAVMRSAAEHGVQLLVFPELSLTGYEPALAAELAIAPEDWDADGLIAAAPGIGEALVIAHREDGRWAGRQVAI